MPWGTNCPTTVQSNPGNGYQSPTVLYTVLLKRELPFVEWDGKKKGVNNIDNIHPELSLSNS